MSRRRKKPSRDPRRRLTRIGQASLLERPPVWRAEGIDSATSLPAPRNGQSFDEAVTEYEREHPGQRVTLWCPTASAAAGSLAGPLADCIRNAPGDPLQSPSRLGRLIGTHLAAQLARTVDSGQHALPYRVPATEVSAAIARAADELGDPSLLTGLDLSGIDDPQARAHAFLQALGTHASNLSGFMASFENFNDLKSLRRLADLAEDGLFDNLHPRVAA